MNKEIIRKNFSRYARCYDRHADIQNLCALRLISKIKNNSFSKILDIGCGTGNFTGLLRKNFPQAYIKALDISKEMVEVAKGKLGDREIKFVIADAETIDFQEDFDLISSNAVFQWFEDLGKALLKYKGLLCSDGIITFSIFGPRTFYELNNSLREFFRKDVSIFSCNFVEAQTIREILQSLFKKAEVDEEVYEKYYGSLIELLEIIKYTGIRGYYVNSQNFWTPNMINRLEEIYKERFKDIIVTYQIFFCKAIK